MAHEPSMMHFLAFKMIIPRDGTCYGCHYGVLGFDHMVRIRAIYQIVRFWYSQLGFVFGCAHICVGNFKSGSRWSSGLPAGRV